MRFKRSGIDILDAGTGIRLSDQEAEAVVQGLRRAARQFGGQVGVEMRRQADDLDRVRDERPID